MELWVILGIAGAAVLFLIVIFNRLVALRRRSHNAFADIDVQLKLRYDLVPNLVETVKGYATHESGTLEKVTQARVSAIGARSMNERIGAERQLSQALVQLFAVAENYPDLKANTNFLELQRELSDIENKIAAARRFFNAAVTEYNTAIEQFPAAIVANMFRFHEATLFELGEAEKQAASQAPKVSFN